MSQSRWFRPIPSPAALGSLSTQLVLLPPAMPWMQHLCYRGSLGRAVLDARGGDNHFFPWEAILGVGF